MKLYKALKLKKSLVGDIAKLKKQIQDKNSYLVGSVNGENFNLTKKYDELLLKIDKLVSLKFVINEANREIQSKIYILSEFKALIAYWNDVSVVEGTQLVGYSDATREYKVHFNETERNDIVNEYQKKVDALQEEIDVFNYNTDIPWGDDE